jgi:hypothetical protein
MLNKKNLLKSAAVLTPLAALAILVSGCGGGGGAASLPGGGGGGGVTTAALSGFVSFPSANVAAAGRANDYQPAPNVTVRLTNLATNTEIATDTTDSTGKYEFNTGVADFTDYKVEAELQADGKTYKVRAIVTTNTPNTTPESQDLDPVTTGAADVVLKQWEEAKTINPGASFGNLEDIADAIDSETREGYVAPDLSDTTAGETKRDEIGSIVAPSGNYSGTFSGARSGKLSSIIHEGKFMVFIADAAEYSTIGGLIAASDEENPTAPEPTSPVAFGSVSGTGVVYATTNDSRFTITGVILGNKGTGTWSDADGQSGSWTLNETSTTTFAGLYSGVLGDFAPEDGGFFAAIVDANNAVTFNAQTADGAFQFFGVGTVNTEGAVSLQWVDATGTTGQSSATITNGTFAGSLPGFDTETLAFSLTRNFDLDWVQ